MPPTSIEPFTLKRTPKVEERGQRCGRRKGGGAPPGCDQGIRWAGLSNPNKSLP